MDCDRKFPFCFVFVGNCSDSTVEAYSKEMAINILNVVRSRVFSFRCSIYFHMYIHNTAGTDLQIQAARHV